MADVLTSTTQLTAEMQIFYDKTFLDTADLVRKYDMLTIKQVMPKNSGKSVYFTRQIHFPVVTASLTEGTNPTAVGFSSENVTATVAEYGYSTKITSLFELTTIDTGLKNKVKELGYHAGLSLDTILRDVLIAGATKQYAGNGATASANQITAINSTDVMSVTELRKAAKTLFDNAAPTWENGMYRGVITSKAQYDLQGDTTTGNWVNVNIYNDGKNAELVKKGVLGRLMGIDLIPTNNGYSESSTTTVYHSLVAGKGAAAEIDIAGTGGEHIIIKTPGSQDTSNPLNMYKTIGWKVDSYVAKVLNSNWIIDIEHA